jgi:alpha-mannosidase
MPKDEAMFVKRTQQIIESLTPTATTPHLLAMNGSDHVEPMPELSTLLSAADAALPDVAVKHGTLPHFIKAVRSGLRAQNTKLATRRGEMRDSAKSPLLPGVLSTRMWIKQRNAACETLLTRWTEPMTAIAEIAGAPLGLQGRSEPLVKQAWRYLLQNHPHDSICGCSIDQVHKEMDVRFDWVEQIGEMVTAASLSGLAAMVDTANDQNQPAVVVFNPTTRQVVVPTAQFAPMSDGVPHEINGAGIQEFSLGVEGAVLNLDILLARGQPPNVGNIKRGQAEVASTLEDGEIEQVHLLIHYGYNAQCAFVAPDVPGLGYRTYWVQPVDESTDQTGKSVSTSIENEFFHIQIDEDGTFTLTDRVTGTLYPGLNRFVDVGDRGDEYNFCPVEQDVVVSASAGKPRVNLVETGSARQTLEVAMTYQVPASLGESRPERSAERIELPIVTRISLSPGVRRVDISTTVKNNAADHRLRVRFPAPVNVDTFDVEGHFDVITRPLDVPTDTAEWVEQPAGTHPQCGWAQVSDGTMGLMVANRGLPEIEALPADHGTELVLTLLRSVGWLSRADMSVRRGHAGPGLPTPEAQCIGECTFDYALIPHGGDWMDSANQAQAFNAPLRAVSTPAHPGALSSQGSFVEVGPETLIVTAIKEAEDGNGLVVRFWNTGEAACVATVKFWRKPAGVSLCTLGERVLEPLEVDETGSVIVPARGREIVTLVAEF